MDREQMMKQAKILRDKKLARMAALANQLRSQSRPKTEPPKVKDGVVQFNQIRPQTQQFIAPPPARVVLPKQMQTQSVQPAPQKITPQKVQQGCSGCRRNLGG